jgi:DNA-binding SARP family transcriptional activator
MLRVQLFGNLRIHDDERRLECFQSTRAKELFCYLLLHRDHPHSRETLAGLFWADCDKNQSRKYLRQALWQLHQSVRHTRHGDDGRCLTVEGEFVSWNERADVLGNRLLGSSRLDDQSNLRFSDSFPDVLQIHGSEMTEFIFDRFAAFERT